MTVELNFDPGFQYVDRQPERRRFVEAVPSEDERRHSAGNRDGDRSHMAKLYHELETPLPSYVLDGWQPDGLAAVQPADPEVSVPEPRVSEEMDPVELLKSGLQLRDTFDHWSGTPGSPDAATMLPLAWQTHAEGYLRTGLAKPAAIKDGLLSPVIDKSRHVKEGITYYLATNPNDPNERSTARLAEADSVEALPTYSLTGEGIHPENLVMMKEAFSSGRGMKEVGALANSSNGHSQGATEILRRIVVDVLSSDESEPRLLFCSMVDRARQGLAMTLAPENFKPIGSPTILEENEFRQETTLVPIVIDVEKFVSNAFAAYKNSDRSSERRRFLKSALYFAEPLTPEYIPEELAAIREKLGKSVLQSVED